MFRKSLHILFFAGLLGFLTPLIAFSQELTDLRKLVDDARLTFEKFVRNPGHTWLQDNVKHAKGVFLIPSLGEAGYIVGGSLGNAVLLLQDEKNREMERAGFLPTGRGNIRISNWRSEIRSPRVGHDPKRSRLFVE